jgi:glucose dehydrogenase
MVTALGFAAAAPGRNEAAPTLATTRSLGSTPATLDWPYFGNGRFQDVDQTNPSNVASLEPAWVFHTGVLDDHASLEVSPIVLNGTMYVTTGHDDVFALDAATGAVLWTFDGTSVPQGGGAQAAPIAYVVNGREFIANAFGGNFADREHFPPNPVGDAIVAFALPPSGP